MWEVGTNALFVGDSTEVEIPDDSVLLVWIYVIGGAGIPSSVRGEAVVVQDYFHAIIHFAYCSEDSVISTVSRIN